MNLPLSRTAAAALLASLALLLATPTVLAQEEAPAPEPAQEETVDVPAPAVEVAPETPAAEEQAWTFRYLIPTSLVIALVAVVGSIIAYFLKVVRTRYRVVR